MFLFSVSQACNSSVKDRKLYQGATLNLMSSEIYIFRSELIDCFKSNKQYFKNYSVSNR